MPLRDEPIPAVPVQPIGEVVRLVQDLQTYVPNVIRDGHRVKQIMRNASDCLNAVVVKHRKYCKGTKPSDWSK